MAYPPNYRYTKQHEWVEVNGDAATIGITDYAQHESRNKSRCREIFRHGGIRKSGQRNLRPGVR
jgi:hypothetical protein